MKSTESFSEQIKRLKNELVRADAVVIGAGAGLSSSAGFLYGGKIPKLSAYKEQRTYIIFGAWGKRDISQISENRCF